MRPLVLLFGLVLAAPASAQFVADKSGWPTADETESQSRGLVLHPLGSGLHPGRPGHVLHGFRVAPETGAFLGYRHGNWLFGSTLAQAEDVDALTALDLSAAYGVNLTRKQRLSVEGGIRLDLSAEMGLRMPNSLAPIEGEQGMGLRMSWRYSFDDNRSFSTSLGFEQSLGDSFDGGAGERNGATFGTYFNYRFY